MARFDDRLPPRGKDGDDFQRFVWEALRSGYFEELLAGRYVRPYFASGNDGGIDHLAIGDQDQIVFESKFFGKDRKEPSSDWTKVSRTLNNNLANNANRPYADVDRLYKPWFDTDRPIKAYWFCTSGIFSPGAQTTLRQDIKKFFVKFAGSYSSLAHLATIDVEVLGWNDFDGVLAAKPPLRFSWFRKLPVGLRPLRSMTEGKTFRRFLEEGELKFFSRETFNQEIGFDNQARLTDDEQSILSTLLEGNDQLGFVLSGPGGVGKTRLALELGLDAEKSNWLVLHVERNTPPEAIEELARSHTSPAQVLLVIDYAEAAKSLFDLAQAMTWANRDGEHRFRYIATCRSSALSAVKEAVEESAYQIIKFSGKADDRYANWVVDKILDRGAIPHANDIAQVCAGLPVLAAFAVFLFERYPLNFSAQFGQIHQGDDFAGWADKRLKLALQARAFDDQSTRRLLAAIAARLPLSAEEYYALRSLNNEAARLLNLLRDDRWIEADDEGATAAHDIFADAIIARYIFEAEGTITDRVGDVFNDAMDAGAFDRALIAVNRLAAHEWFGEIDGLQAIRRAHTRRPEPIIAARELLLKTRLPGERTCIRILAALPDVANAVAADMSCDGPLSYLAEVTAASKDEEWRDHATSILRPFLDRAVERSHQSNMIVRRSLRLLPAQYRDPALARIRREPTRLETHFLLVAWLRSRLPLEEIAADVESWLVGGGATQSKASFVFSAWLDAAAKLDKVETAAKIAMVEPHVLAWLGKHGAAEDAQFVYSAWLDAAAKLDKVETAAKIAMVEPHVLAWLGKHGAAEDAQFVYPAWLDAAAKLDKVETAAKIAMVEPHVLAWLGKHGAAEDAQFVYPAWLDAAAKLDKVETAAKIATVEPHVLAWLGKHAAAEAAQFVYHAWLGAAAKLDKVETAAKIAMVETHVLAWLGKHAAAEAAQFVYPAWLDAAAKLDKVETAAKIAMVETHVLAWLGKHAAAEDASFVYPAWLNAGGSGERIRSSMIEWLSANPGHQQSDFIIKAWLEATRDFVAVRKPAFAWLKQNTKNPNAVYVLKFIVKDRDIPPESVKNVISWCWMFRQNKDAICRIGPVLSHFAQGALERRLIVAALLVLKNVRMDWLGDKGVRVATLTTIGCLALKTRFVNGIEARLDHIHANILLNSATYSRNLVADNPKFVLNPALPSHVAGMVGRRVFDPETNMAALERFADWLAAWPPEKKPSLRTALGELQKSARLSNLWDRVGVPEKKLREEPSIANPPKLEDLLEQLNDMQMTPHDWSNLWEKTGWKYFPGEPRLITLAQKWMYEAAPDPSWPYVWQPLFLFFPEDQQYLDIALWWLEHRGPRDRGAWTFVWKLLWDNNHARDRLAPLGGKWLEEFKDRQHKYWNDVHDRLNAAEFEPR